MASEKDRSGKVDQQKSANPTGTSPNRNNTGGSSNPPGTTTSEQKPPPNKNK